MADWYDRLRQRYTSLTPAQQRWLAASFFMLLQAFIWLVLFQKLWYGDKVITDTPVYYDYASRMARDLVPYVDFSSEYPPLAMLLFSLPRLLSGDSYQSFVFWFELEMLIFSCGTIALLAAVSGRLFGGSRRTLLVLALYTLFVLSIGSIVQARFDIAVAFLILASVTTFIFDRRLLAWILLGLGLMTKVIPVLIGPLFLIAHYRRRQTRELWLGPLLALLAAGIVALPFLLMSPAGLAGAFLYHVERPLQIESSWASPLLILSSISDYQVVILNSYGSHNVFASLSDAFAQLSGPVTIFLLLGVYWFYWREGFDGKGGWSRLALVQFTAITVALFILGGKVFSPQFLIWLLPLVPLLTSAKRPWPGAIYWAVLVLTQVEFPHNYWKLFMLDPGMIYEVALRNLMLGVLVLVLLFFSRREDGAARSP